MSTGINPRLLEVVKAVNNYCGNHGIKYDIACDESDLQGIKLFQKNRKHVNGLLSSIDNVLDRNNIHLETEKVRGGTILAFSLEAIAENQMHKIIRSIGEMAEPLTFQDKIEMAMDGRLSESTEPEPTKPEPTKPSTSSKPTTSDAAVGFSGEAPINPAHGSGKGDGGFENAVVDNSLMGSGSISGSGLDFKDAAAAIFRATDVLTNNPTPSTMGSSGSNQPSTASESEGEQKSNFSKTANSIVQNSQQNTHGRVSNSSAEPSESPSDSESTASDNSNNSTDQSTSGATGTSTGTTKTPMGRKNLFNNDLERALSLVENMTGMATPNDSNPDELFARFAKSLKVLGKQMGIGPLQDRLKEQGIKWKKSDDGMNVILYIVNGETKAPQPIARISADVLSKPNEFEKALKDILDFAKGEAPGAFQQEMDALRDQSNAIRDIAKSVSPEQQSEIAQQMMDGQPPQQSQPEVPQPERPMDFDAAQQAASVK